MFVFVLDVFLQFGQPRPGSGRVQAGCFGYPAGLGRAQAGRLWLLPSQASSQAGTRRMPPTGRFWGTYLRGLLPHWFPISQASFPPPLLTFWSLLSLYSSMILTSN